MKAGSLSDPPSALQLPGNGGPNRRQPSESPDDSALLPIPMHTQHSTPRSRVRRFWTCRPTLWVACRCGGHGTTNHEPWPTGAHTSRGGTRPCSATTTRRSSSPTSGAAARGRCARPTAGELRLARRRSRRRWTRRSRNGRGGARRYAAAAGAGPESTRRLPTGSTMRFSPSSVRDPRIARSSGSPNTTSSGVTVPAA